MNLHGAGAIGAGWEWETNYDAVADAHGFIVVYPDGIDFSWADGRGASVPDRQGVDDVGFITGLVAKLVSDFGVDPGHVFATGMSAGAFMVNRLACERADVFAAIAPVAGTLGVNVGCAP
ncbi:MAG: polyhydroxybutyrate depolymerase, partial [Mycobacterium sp.]|nr:polyhydroxybutyrate depolymerase [Mycobacterium sp.]